MSKSFKKILFSSLVVTLFIVANLIGLKYTTIFGYVVSMGFMLYPFIALSILLLFDTFSKKDAYYAITSTIFIQMFLLIFYSLTSSLNGQLIVPDIGSAVSQVFHVDEVRIMGSLIAFMIANYFLIYTFDFFRRIKQRMIGFFLGSVISLTVYSIINIFISSYGFGKEIVIELILGHSVVNGIMALVTTVIFFFLKEKECEVEEEICLECKCDKNIVDVINLKEEQGKKKIKKNSSTKSDSMTQNKKENATKKSNISSKSSAKSSKKNVK